MRRALVLAVVVVGVRAGESHACERDAFQRTTKHAPDHVDREIRKPDVTGILIDLAGEGCSLRDVRTLRINSAVDATSEWFHVGIRNPDQERKVERWFFVRPNATVCSPDLVLMPGLNILSIRAVDGEGNEGPPDMQIIAVDCFDGGSAGERERTQRHRELVARPPRSPDPPFPWAGLVVLTLSVGVGALALISRRSARDVPSTSTVAPLFAEHAVHAARDRFHASTVTSVGAVLLFAAARVPLLPYVFLVSSVITLYGWAAAHAVLALLSKHATAELTGRKLVVTHDAIRSSITLAERECIEAARSAMPAATAR